MAITTVETHSVCTLDCPDTCSLTVTVTNDRIVSIKGSHANPYTGGVLCAKVPASYPEFVHGDARILTPLKRVGPRGGKTFDGHGPSRFSGFERISWRDAIETIHARFTAIIKEYGPQAIMPLNYAGPHGQLAVGSMDYRFFHKLGATQLDRKPLCGGIRTEAWTGTFGGVPGMRPEHVEHANVVIAWGNNVTWSNLHLMPVINKARKRGAKLIVVDTRRTPIARQADLHVAIAPGTDVVLAWAMAAELERRGAFDREFIATHVHGLDEYMADARRYSVADAARICAIPEAQIHTMVEWYATLSPAAISVGNGLERNQNGGSGIRAIFALPALTGKFGVPGGGLVNGARNAYPLTPNRLRRPDLVPAGTRMLNIIDVGAHLLDPTLAPPIKAVFMYNHNALVVHPDQNRLRRGLMRDDLFIVGSDVAMTDSMQFADLILPASSHFEHDDIYPAYGTHWLQRAEPVIPPQGESLSPMEMFRRLSARFGFTDTAFTASDRELMDDALDPNDARLGGFRPSTIPTDRAMAMTKDGDDWVMFRNVFPATTSGKVELTSSYLAEKYGARMPRFLPVQSRYPLALLTPASDRRTTSTFGQTRGDGVATPPLEIHPDDAKARGLTTGMRVRVFNDLGEVHLPLLVTDVIPRGVVCSLKGAWMGTSDNGQTVSALCPAHHADIAEGACFNDARVEVAAL